MLHTFCFGLILSFVRIWLCIQHRVGFYVRVAGDMSGFAFCINIYCVRLREDINSHAEAHYEVLNMVKGELPRLLGVGEVKTVGSFVTKTYILQSDVDVLIECFPIGKG